MKYSLITLLVYSILILGFISCKNNNDSDDGLIPEEFQRMWEFDENESGDGYYLFFEEESLVIYEDAGLECMYRYTDNLISRDGERYTFRETDFEDNSTYSVYLKTVDGTLWASGVRTFETKEIYVKSDSSKSSFEPFCTDNFKSKEKPEISRSVFNKELPVYVVTELK
ncbi:MAG: hypothetical protein RIC57_09485 [Balneola sp.]